MRARSVGEGAVRSFMSLKNVVFSNSNKDTLLDMLKFELFFLKAWGVGQAAVRCNRLVSARPRLQSGARTGIIRVSNGRQSGMSWCP